MIKIYPSASGFMWGKSTITKYNSACPRYLLAAQGAKRVDIDQAYQDLGAHHEEDQEARLGDLLSEREQVLKGPVIEGVEYSGRLDFWLRNNVVVETKASFSDSTLYDVIRKGKVNINHIAQLVFYMIRKNTVKGILAVGYYTMAGEQYIQEGYREFVVTIDDLGAILIDNEPSGYTVADQLRHTTEVAKALLNREIYPRPLNGYSFDGPCKRCPMKDVCDKYEAAQFYSDETTAMTTDKFIELGRTAIESQTPMVAKPKQRKKK